MTPLIQPIKKYQKHYLKIVFSILVLFVFTKWAKIDDYSIIWKGLSNTNFWLGCTLLVLLQFVKTLRLQILVTEYNIKIDFLKNLLIHFIIPIYGLVTPAKLGEGTKLLLIGQNKEKVGFCFILEKIMDMGILFILGAIGLYRYTIFINSLYFFIPILLVAIIALIYFDKIFNLLFQRIFKKKLEKNWFMSNLWLFAKPKLLITLVLTVLIWVMNIYAAQRFSLVVDPKFAEISFFNFAPVFASCIIVGLFSGFPGGIGSREATISYLFFQIFKIDISIGGIFSILNLFGNYLTFIVIGILGYLIFTAIYRNSEVQQFR